MAEIRGKTMKQGMEELRLTITGPGWTDVIEPTSGAQIAKAMNEIALPSKEGTAIDQIEMQRIAGLRGEIKGIRWVLQFFKQKLEAFDGEQIALERRTRGEKQEAEPLGSPYAPDGTEEPEGQPSQAEGV